MVKSFSLDALPLLGVSALLPVGGVTVKIEAFQLELVFRLRMVSWTLHCDSWEMRSDPVSGWVGKKESHQKVSLWNRDRKMEEEEEEEEE
ncbi:uncharacterized, partial [Tachysurus ichikawai]